MMKLSLRSVSSAAILIGLAGAFPAWAQVTPQTVDEPEAEQDTQDRVVVTGSFIQGSAEDAALPVEVYSQEDQEKRGAPSVLEFAKSLAISGPTTGESYYNAGAANAGTIRFNLRGLGSDKTLTLLNGRRISQNANNIPSAALARTELLKDGAAVIYGADATGGVVNFITRDNFVGLEASAKYTAIAGSDGDYGASLLGGFGEGDSNFLWSVEWQHRSRLNMDERDYAIASFDRSVNPAPWSNITNLDAWTPRGALPASPSVANEFGTATGAAIADFTPTNCAAIGGSYVAPAGSTPARCGYNYASYLNLVDGSDAYRAYAQFNSAISDNMDFHIDVSYGQVLSPHVIGSPAGAPLRGTAMAIGQLNQFYVPTTNPYAAAFAASHAAPAGTQGFTAWTYRTLAHGGNPLGQEGGGDGWGSPTKVDNQVWHISSDIKGTLGAWAGFASDVGYQVGLTYNQSIAYSDLPEVLNFRFQEALNGFGGAGCSATDLDPNRFGTQNPGAAGKNGCSYWNPFATSFASAPTRGLTNPQYVAGQENSFDLVKWLFDPRAGETINSDLTLDAVFNGTSGISLPGGEVGWALGVQGRQLELREQISGEFYNGSMPCEWPTNFTSQNGVGSPSLPQIPVTTTSASFRGCTPDRPGPFAFYGPNQPDYNDRQQFSVFGEVEAPVLDTLHLQLALRREEFSGGLGATVYKVSGKWDVWGPLSVRGSYGTNYQAPPVALIPGQVINGSNNYATAGGAWLGAITTTASGIVPETATSWNTGVIWQSEGFAPDHDLRIIVDYFNIETENPIGVLADVNRIVALVFNGPGNTITTCDSNVQPLLNRVSFNVPCSAGLNATGAFSAISTVRGNGPGQATAGFDYQISYEMPVGPGDLSLGLTATQVTKLFTGPTALDGVQITDGDNRLGTLNFSGTAQVAPKWRGNVFANYAIDAHNFRLGYNYVSAVTDERAGVQYGENGEAWATLDFTYLFNVTDNLRLTFSANNILDRDPPKAQTEMGYDPLLGNSLGRTLEFAVKQTF